MGDLVDAWPRISERLRRDRAAQKPDAIQSLWQRISYAQKQGRELIRYGTVAGFVPMNASGPPGEVLTEAELRELASLVTTGWVLCRVRKEQPDRYEPRI